MRNHPQLFVWRKLLISKIFNLYNNNEKYRFLIVGGINTLIGFLLFAFFQSVFGKTYGYFVSLYVSTFFASLIAFILHRSLVFKVTGSVFRDYFRFQVTYIFPLIVSSVLLPIFVSIFGWNVYLSQALILGFLAVVSFFGHKYFSFRR